MNFKEKQGQLVSIVKQKKYACRNYKNFYTVNAFIFQFCS